MAHALGEAAVGVEPGGEPAGIVQRPIVEVGPQRGRVVEADLEPVLVLVQPELLVRLRRAEQLGLLGVKQEVGGPRTLDVVDGLELVLDLVDELQLGSPPPGGRSPASTSTLSSVSLPVRRHDS